GWNAQGPGGLHEGLGLEAEDLAPDHPGHREPDDAADRGEEGDDVDEVEGGGGEFARAVEGGGFGAGLGDGGVVRIAVGAGGGVGLYVTRLCGGDIFDALGDPGLDDGVDGDGQKNHQEDVGKAVEDIHDAHHDRVGLAAGVGGDGA